MIQIQYFLILYPDVYGASGEFSNTYGMLLLQLMFEIQLNITSSQSNQMLDEYS